MKMNKKGISTIVATVLIVLITVAAVTILWAAISPLIDRNLTEGTACFKATEAIKLDMDQRYTCNGTDGLHYRLSRKPNTDFLKGFEISLEVDGSTDRTIINDTLPTENGMKKYDNLTIIAGTDIKISIAPRVLIGGAITSCDLSTPVTLNKCPT